MTDNVVFYHKACLDGLAAAWAAWTALGDTATYHAIQYKEPVPVHLCEGKNVYVVDFSFTEEDTEAVIKVAKELNVIDHHATAEKPMRCMCEKHKSMSFHFDLQKSGAVLSWEYFATDLGGPAPILLQHVQDRDLWRFQIANTKEVNAWLKTRPFTIESFDEAVRLVENPGYYNTTVMSVGKAILEYQDSLIRSAIKTPRILALRTGEMLGQEVWVPIFNCTGNIISDACNKFLELNPAYDIVASYFDTDTSRVFSLRSRAGVDCSPIAKYYGGGGHAQACGFSVPRRHVLAVS